MKFSPKSGYALLLSALIIIGCDNRSAPPPPAPAVELKQDQPQSLPTINLTLGNRAVTLQVADDDAEREKGLMYRKNMAANEGMIFVFPTESPRAFWMKNTPIDLDIVYLDRKGKIVSIRTMYAYDQSGVPSDGDAMYAIELNAGVAKEIGLTSGQVIDLPDSLRAGVR